MAREDNYILDMQNITKIFPGVKANDNVNLSIKKGEIHALVGENGAGKTTLMNVLYGLYDPEGGQVFYEGNKVNVDGPQDAIDLGIGMVHQHFMLVDPLTVTENIILGNEPRKGLKINQKKARKEVEDISNKYGLYVDPDAKIQDISVGMQQRVEIIKTLYRGADLLIFDEPTAVLTPQEIDELFDIFRSLKEQGKTIIFITHKLQEVKEISDRITVLRGGKSIDTVDTANVSEEDVAELMVGRPVLLEVEKDKAKPGKDFLTIENLKVKNNRNIQAVNGVSLTVKKGEILGIAGLIGAGRTELARAIVGADKIDAGEVFINGKKVEINSPEDAIKHGIVLLPEDRKAQGLSLIHDVKFNCTISNLGKYKNRFFLNAKKEIEDTQRLIKDLSIKTPSASTRVEQLSGGNQQKVVIAKSLNAQADIFIFDEPTRGIDVGTKVEIYKIMNRLVTEGKAVIMISSELPEILGMSDRIIVMHEGEITAVFKREEATQEKILAAAIGGGINYHVS